MSTVILIERHANPLCFSPDNVAWPVTPIGDQSEVFGNFHRSGCVQSGASGRQIADHAIDRAAVEFNRSDLQEALPWKSPFFDHEASMGQKCKKWIKRLMSATPFRAISAAASRMPR